MPPAGKAKFADGEKLLCYHGPLLYEAKCVRSKKDGNSHQYYVHYQGWNKNWDEWVGESRILKINQENLDKKDKLLNSHINAVKEGKRKGVKPGGPEGPGKRQGGPGGGGKSGSGSGGSNSGSATPVSASGGLGLLSGGGGNDSASNSRASTPVSDRSVKVGPPLDKGPTKRVQADDEKSTSSREDEVQFQTTRDRRSGSKKAKISASQSVEVKQDEESDVEDKSEASSLTQSTRNGTKFKINIPEELKYVLVSDWDLLTHKKYLFSLPAKVTASSILSDWVKHIESNTSSSTSSWKNVKVGTATEVAAGLRSFFDAYVGKFLLYKVERQQHKEVMKAEESKTPSEIYGSAHLLRLMVKIGGFLDQFSVNGDEQGVKIIENSIGDFLQYLEINRGKLFTSKNYVEATDEYLKNVD